MRSSAMSARLAVLAVLMTSVIVHAQDDAPLAPVSSIVSTSKGRHRPASQGTSRTRMSAPAGRALAEHLQPSTTPGGIGYYVGGGVPLGHGQPRRCDEGTWGWDETGCPWLPTRVRLLWTHGRRYQGGTGAYVTDGPHVPDRIAGFYGGLKNLHGTGRE